MEVFAKIANSKLLTIFVKKLRLMTCNFIKKKTPKKVFSCDYC